MRRTSSESRGDAIKARSSAMGFLRLRSVSASWRRQKASAGKVSFSDVTFFRGASRVSPESRARQPCTHASSPDGSGATRRSKSAALDTDYCSVLQRWPGHAPRGLVCTGASIAISGAGVVMPSRDLTRHLAKPRRRDYRAAGCKVDIRLYADGVYELINQ